ncbi:cysteine hydrolase family protein [Methanospirillum stamsii]|uniref:Cysteine hydrolase n=1 Tax=Methanospirillum stamsii TaxID=1277351 RepID=A0A2V2N4W0_9EURY|nr:isochorismatase family cysteine hydrolase [Methanospirillum stamsii]PWR75124.1 cysteine hydrolase [Methanospirillum stamsii]
MKKPALLIIDMQNDFASKKAVLPVAGAENVISPLTQVLSEFRARNLPIFHVVRVHHPDGSDVEWFRAEKFKSTPFAVRRTPGADVIDELKPKPGEYLLEKTRMSAFIGTGLDLTLRTLGIEIVVIAGIQTPNCIRTTVFDAMAYNYETVLVNDATGAQTREIHEANVLDMKNIGVTVINAPDLANWLDSI